MAPTIHGSSRIIARWILSIVVRPVHPTITPIFSISDDVAGKYIRSGDSCRVPSRAISTGCRESDTRPSACINHKHNDWASPFLDVAVQNVCTRMNYTNVCASFGVCRLVWTQRNPSKWRLVLRKIIPFLCSKRNEHFVKRERKKQLHEPWDFPRPHGANFSRP